MSERKSIIDTIFLKYQISGYDMLINIIESYKNHKCNTISVENTHSNIEYIPEHKKLETEIKEIKKVNDNSNKIYELTSRINSLTSQIDDIKINHKKEIEELKSGYECKLKEKEKPLPTPSNSNENKNELITGDQILEKYPVYIFPATNDECCKYAAGELCNEIEYNYNIKNLVNNQKTSLELLCNYILSEKKLISPTTRKYEVEKKIKRCYYLYKTYGEDLKRVSFSIGRLTRLGKVKWELWLNEFDNIMKKLRNKKYS
jgi:hypothetical protein